MSVDFYGQPETPAMTWAQRIDVWAPRILVVTLAILALIASCSIASGHDIYAGVTNQYGTLCCNDRDCRQVPWREADGTIEYNIDGYWLRAEPHNDVGPIDNAAHACWPQGSSPPSPRCLMPPGAGA